MGSLNSLPAAWCPRYPPLSEGMGLLSLCGPSGGVLGPHRGLRTHSQPLGCITPKGSSFHKDWGNATFTGHLERGWESVSDLEVAQEPEQGFGQDFLRSKYSSLNPYLHTDLSFASK